MSINLFKSSEKRGSFGDRFRAKRFEFFEKCIATLEKPVKILDIGGRDYFWENRGYQERDDLQITLLNLMPQEARFENIRSMIGDATDLSQFPDDHFDIAFSNSVIEHLYTWENQKKMASETIRVAKHYYIQTPNKYFPIEPHYRMPYFNFFPRPFAKVILTKTPLSLGKVWPKEQAERSLAEIRLLSLKELRELYPEGSVYTERFLGGRKSFTAHNFPVT